MRFEPVVVVGRHKILGPDFKTRLLQKGVQILLDIQVRQQIRPNDFIRPCRIPRNVDFPGIKRGQEVLGFYSRRARGSSELRTHSACRPSWNRSITSLLPRTVATAPIAIPPGTRTVHGYQATKPQEPLTA